MAATGPGLLVIERILRDRDGIWTQIADERELNRLIGNMMASSAIALACYGAVLGSFNSALMSLTSAVKLPLLFLATLAICLPALYLFNLVFGARLSVRQALALVMTALTVVSMLSLAFAPISLFFRITSPDYEFFKVLNVAILALTAFVGLRFLTSGMRALNALTDAAAVPAPVATSVAGPADQRQLTPVTATVGAAGSMPAGAAGASAALPAAGSGADPAAGRSLVPVGHANASVSPANALVAQGFLGRPSAPVAPPAAAGEKSGSMGLLYVWILLFGFVGTQLAWTLRPFFGAPTEEFALFRHLDGTFFGSVLSDLGKLLGGG